MRPEGFGSIEELGDMSQDALNEHHWMWQDEHIRVPVFGCPECIANAEVPPVPKNEIERFASLMEEISVKADQISTGMDSVMHAAEKTRHHYGRGYA